MVEEKYVLFLDILGFKDLIENNTTEVIKDIYEQQVIRTIGTSIDLASKMYGFPISITHKLDGNILKDSIQDIFQIHIMSDSIIIWTNDIENVSLAKLIGFSSVFLAMTFILGVPLRGGISKGSISELKTPVNNVIQSCIVGEGIVNAYKLEGKQNWMGCIVDEKCFEGTSLEIIEKLISGKDNSLTKYKVPIKKKNAKGKLIYGSETNYVINWTNVKGVIKKDKKFFEDKFSKFNKGIEHRDIKNKIRNTFDFFLQYADKD